MKKVLIVALATVALAACNQEASLESEKSKFSYLVGQDVGTSLKHMSDEIDVAAFQAGFEANLRGEESRISAADAEKVKKSFIERKQKELAAKARENGEANKKSGAAFLAANKQKEGITETPSGLQYEVLTPADGEKPSASSTVRVHYRGTFMDGEEFDSSYKRGEPAEFPLMGVIPGWTEGLQLMSVGSKYRFFVPSALAYGEQGRGKIGPNALLIFEIELLDIVKAEKGGK